MEDASETTLVLNARVTGSSSKPVFADIDFNKSLMTLEGGIVDLGSGAYRATFKTRNDLGGGQHSDRVRFRLCADPACADVYPGSTQTADYVVNVVLKDWFTFQRNAAHTGYVRLNVDISKIRKIWEYQLPQGGLTRVAADKHRAYVSGYQGGSLFTGGTIRAINLADGSSAWNYDLGATSYMGDPAISNGRVYVSSMVSSSGYNPITTLDAETGKFIHNMTFASQWSSFLAGTPADEDFYTASGYYGNVVYNHRQSDGVLKWTAHGGGYNVWHAETPAVDARNVYFYSGSSLTAIDRTSGNTAFTIADPFESWGGYDYGGAPVIVSDGSILAFSGTTGGGGYFEPQYGTQRPIVRYLTDPAGIAWRTADAYRTQPATDGDLIYAARNAPARLDALNIRDGTIAWSWSPPGDSTLHGQLLVTENAIFVSTNDKIYCLSLRDRSVVWTHDAPGVFAIAPGNILVISEALVVSPPGSASIRSNGKLVAVRLR